MIQKKLLMLNSSIHDVPLILEARKLGYYVITTSNKPDYPGHSFANEYINCNYMDYDALVKLCKENDISAVSCGTSDNASYAAAYLGEYFGWKGHDNLETLKTLHFKDKFKQFTKNLGIKAPISKAYFSEASAIFDSRLHKFPVIIKPVDCAGGQGISVANNIDEYEIAIHNAFEVSKQKRIIVETYLVGTQHSFISFIVDQKVTNYCSWDDLPYPGRFMISKGAVPASYPNPEYVNLVLIQEIEKIAKALKLVDGLFHLQCIVQNGEPYIIEVMRRTPGNWDTYMTTNASGINWDQWIIMAESGMDCHGIPKMRKTEGFWGYYMILGSKNGRVKDIVIDNKIKKNIWRMSLWKPIGHIINDYQNDKLGLVHLWFNTRDEMNNKMKHIDDLIAVVY